MSAITAALATPSTSQNEPVSSDASRKRNIADAIHTLDEAIGPSTSDLSPPSQRHHGTRSIYTTLAKYGIKTKEPRAATSSLSLKSEALVKAPHRSAFLSRTASRRKKAPAIASSSQTTSLPGKEFSPSSVPSFICRLGTFKFSTYGNKPLAIDAVAAAKRGWTSDGVKKDRLVCDFRGASWVVAGPEGLSWDAARRKQRLQLALMHKDLCPWKTRQCDDPTYRIPLKPPAHMARDVKARALLLEPLLESIQIRHPLTSTPVSAHHNTLASVTVPPPFQPTSASQVSLSIPPEPTSSPPPVLSLRTVAFPPCYAEQSDRTPIAALIDRVASALPFTFTAGVCFISHSRSTSSASGVQNAYAFSLN
ncbi:hypothetical protein PUNSTDRAFT_133486 [Punctularia strigosozonata HHB-11173 SS5]|uniref:uncharacterized protein n=1 Tax=Punctularia strigosozonata (strain HHB-11173) TaxID=741275 RepID=UPI0004418690|nr:uncharacterized protein PUNSTDRAFT_133486 [Punctularia strigosozonata HHB-11173 SS5]EIN09713.1 hypothetical protein PUNSTDRAFT_133486 [Punctularia strigosozonata HHB-11173 SS5]